MWERLRAAVERWGEERKGCGSGWSVDAGRQSSSSIAGVRSRSSFWTVRQPSWYGLCDACRSFAEIRRAFPDVVEQALRACLEAWVARRWVYHSRSDYYLALAVEADPPAYQTFPKGRERTETLAAA